jgi:hypothetical protein
MPDVCTCTRVEPTFTGIKTRCMPTGCTCTKTSSRWQRAIATWQGRASYCLSPFSQMGWHPNPLARPI